jgi:2-polyprenyl-6-methoxyphenol hydroxylase-like FAD-dependent oxidoreductase
MPESNTADATAPVLIVGAGPVGLVLAHELASHGVRSVLADRADEPTRFPKMDITNGRSMELLRRLGLGDRVRALAVSSEHTFDVVFATGLDENDPRHREIGRWELPSVDTARRIIRYVNDGSMPAEPSMRCSQTIFESELRRSSVEHPLIDFRPGLQFVRLDQDDEGVTTLLTDTAGQPTTVRSSYVAGCDGASSAVRGFLGIDLEGLGGVVQLTLVHFRSRDTERLHRFGRFWHIYCGSGATVIAQDEVDTYTVHTPTPPDTDPADVDPVALVQAGLGAPIEVDEVLLTSRWAPNLLVADRYRDGRVLLAGDAVHQVIPTGGYGMNTGIAEAVDLGWKLAAMVNGWGGDVLLDSYEIERRPVALANRDRSMRHSLVIGGYHHRVREPDIVAVGLAGDEARAGLAQWLEQERGENESFGTEFGYRYHDSPVVAHDGSPEPLWDPMTYTPTTWPGGRAPHVYLTDGTALFDLIGGGLTLVDLTGERRDPAAAARWSAAAAARNVPFEIVTIDEPAVRQIWERNLVLVRRDHHVAWRDDVHPDDPGAVLDLVRGVRPSPRHSPPAAHQHPEPHWVAQTSNPAEGTS